MRLTCPNCEARYEIPDEVIPLDGRDVECSACGKVWFQTHADHPAAAPEADAPDADVAAAEPATAAPEDPAADSENAATVHAETETETETETRADPAPAQDPDAAIQSLLAEPAETVERRSVEGEADSATASSDPEDADIDDDDESREAEPAFIAPQRKLDKSVIDILEQEAERETRLRAAEAAPAPATQSDRGLPEGDGARAADIAGMVAPTRPDNLRSAMPRAVPIAAPEAGTDEPDDDDDALADVDAAAMAPEPRRSGFALGFGLVALLAAILILTYANARVIAQNVPQLDPALNNYVGMVNQGRVWLDTQVSMMLPK